MMRMEKKRVRTIINTSFFFGGRTCFIHRVGLRVLNAFLRLANTLDWAGHVSECTTADATLGPVLKTIISLIWRRDNRGNE